MAHVAFGHCHKQLEASLFCRTSIALSCIGRAIFAHVFNGIVYQISIVFFELGQNFPRFLDSAVPKRRDDVFVF